jgi:holliday junction DNA helicase RuvA
MIAAVRGRLAAKSGELVVVETADGVGYEVIVPLNVMERLPTVGDTVSLHTELVVRDDGWYLYGFVEPEERRVFQRLMSAAGVGPRLALALLSGLGRDRLVRAIRDKDVPLLTTVSGVGKKTAERITVELADKMGDLAAAPASGPPGSRPAAVEAQRALEQLGYSTLEADQAIRAVLAGDGAADVGTVVKRALQHLAGR